MSPAREKRAAKAVARVLKDFRKRRKLTVEELAKKTGLTVARIENFESGVRSPYLEEFFSLACAFRIRAWRLSKHISDAVDKMLPPQRRRRTATPLAGEKDHG